MIRSTSLAMLAVAGTIAAPLPALAAPSGRASVDVDIDASTLGTFEAPMIERLDYEAASRIRETDLELAADDAAADATLHMTVKFRGASKVDFLYSIEARIDGRVIEGTAKSGRCDRCVREGVVKQLALEMPDELAAIQKALASTEDTAGPAVPPPDASELAPSPLEPTPASDDSAKRRLGPKGVAGLVVGGVGVVGLAVGLGLMLRPMPYDDTADDSERQRATNTRPAGIGLTAAGAAAIVVAIPLLVLDRRQAKRRVSVTPSVGRRGAGFVLSARF